MVKVKKWQSGKVAKWQGVKAARYLNTLQLCNSATLQPRNGNQW
jgi:hypothetical protein